MKPTPQQLFFRKVCEKEFEEIRKEFARTNPEVKIGKVKYEWEEGF